MPEYSITVKIVMYRQYEVVAQNEDEAQDKALAKANQDMPYDASNSVDEISKR